VRIREARTFRARQLVAKRDTAVTFSVNCKVSIMLHNKRVKHCLMWTVFGEDIK